MSDEQTAAEQVAAARDDIVESVPATGPLPAKVPDGEPFTPIEAPPERDPAENPRRLVEIVDPRTPGDATATVTFQAYEQTWARRGFRMVSGRDDAGQIYLAPPLDLPEADASDGEGSTFDPDVPVETSTGPEVPVEGLGQESGPRSRRPRGGASGG